MSKIRTKKRKINKHMSSDFSDFSSRLTLPNELDEKYSSKKGGDSNCVKLKFLYYDNLNGGFSKQNDIVENNTGNNKAHDSKIVISTSPSDLREQKLYKCNELGCDRKYSRLNKLTEHMRMHTGEKPYRCPAPGCVKTFRISSYLRKHIRVHTGERPYQCDEPGCEKEFTRFRSLESHIKTAHGGDEPYKCDECGKGFARSDILRAHKIVHIDEI